MRHVSVLLLAVLVVLHVGCGGGGTSAPPPPPQPTVTVSPSPISVRAGDTQQFNATVTGSTNTQVTWAVNGVAGGNAANGTISAAGLYTAPVTLPNPANVTVRATAAGSSASGSASVDLLNPIPVLTSISPTVSGIGNVLLTVTGSKFASGAQVEFGGSAVTTTFVSSTQLTATVNPNQTGNVAVRVTNPNPGSAQSGSVNLQVISVSVGPGGPAVRIGETQQFTATVSGTANTQVAWNVNGISGGNAAVGTISASGLYSAPAVLPNPASVTVQATSVLGPVSGSTNVALQNPVPVVSSINPTVAGLGTFTLTVEGDKFVAGAQIEFGGALVVTSMISATQLRATVNATQAGNVAVRVTNPNPGSVSSTPTNLNVVSTTLVSARAAARFLEQATFGPTAESINQVTRVGFTQYLTDQFNAPSSGFDDPVPDASGNFGDPAALQRRWWTNALYGPDQLRQRAAFSLHKIWVVSWVVVEDSRAFTRYLRMHQGHAFGNYRAIMENVTKDPGMGRYQDIANNDGAANRTVSCNENYGRELMQLFTIGLYKLNADGTLQRDAQNQPIPAYDPVFTVEQNACAMTGWTYTNPPGQNRNWPRPTFYEGPLVPVDSHHDMTAKTLIDNFPVPAGLTADAELDLVLDNIFANQNIAPFVSKLLIQQFVTSNPSPAYVARVAQAFATGTFAGPGATFGGGQPGDMQAVLAAILLDAEARLGDDAANDNDPHVVNGGKLKEPILFVANVLRAVGAVSDGGVSNRVANSGQRLLFPPTVFSYFSPEYAIPGTNLLGPEFNIHTTATTFDRVNLMNTITCGVITSTNPCVQFSGTLSINYSPFATLAANPDAQNQLLDVLNWLMLRGTMSAQLRTSLLNAMNAVPNDANRDLHRARTAIYLTVSSSQYQVHR